jgi:hypothetical protein
LVSNGNDVTITFCGNDAHLCLLPTLHPPQWQVR